ncbi:hypothetical protein B0H19DRAFT_1234242 [Mycena capillaripes]|nr:hypothetical protein B0H19DRAFT_1234242 [Mycena capillaripes]
MSGESAQRSFRKTVTAQPAPTSHVTTPCTVPLRRKGGREADCMKLGGLRVDEEIPVGSAHALTGDASTCELVVDDGVERDIRCIYNMYTNGSRKKYEIILPSYPRLDQREATAGARWVADFLRPRPLPIPAPIAVVGSSGSVKYAAALHERARRDATLRGAYHVAVPGAKLPDPAPDTEREIGDAPWNQRRTSEPRGMSVDSTCIRARLRWPTNMGKPELGGHRKSHAGGFRIVRLAYGMRKGEIVTDVAAASAACVTDHGCDTYEHNTIHFSYVLHLIK